MHVRSCSSRITPTPVIKVMHHPYRARPLTIRLLPAVAVVIALFVSPETVRGQDGAAGYVHDRDAPRALAQRITEPITIDGRLDEAVWEEASPVTEFTQVVPNEGQPASQRTEVRFLYDDEAIYVGARLHDTGEIRGRLGRRDMPLGDSDWLTVIFDSYHDHRTAYGFEVNPRGVRSDQSRAGGREDPSWDPVWEVATTVDDEGWTVEMRIPFSQLRFSGEPVQTWGLQVERSIARNREFSVWSFTPQDQPGGIPRFGHLTGLERIPTGKRLEVLPYTVARAAYVDPRGNPFRTGSEYDLDAGVDLKYRVTSDLTLDATVNPDFGQVEVDPAVINLSAFETFFQERRPFFIEGADIFRFGTGGANQVFYSRRIGRQPSLAPPFAARDVPDATRILGAAKLSGRTAGGWSIGVMDAVTRREIARFHDQNGALGEVVAEPLTNYFVSRARREMRTGQTAVGGFFGAVNRQLDTDRLADALRSGAYTGGFDLFHQWDDRTWTLEGFLGGSHIRGTEAVIAAAQRAPYVYMQRPDADHLDYDPARTALTGFSGEASLARRWGRHWNARLQAGAISPGYDVNDLGFQRRGDRIDADMFVNFSETRPGEVFRQISTFGSARVEHNWAGERVFDVFGVGGFFQFLNYWSANLNLNASSHGTLDDRLTRGGPAALRPGGLRGFVGVRSDSRRAVVGSVDGMFSRDREGGYGTSGSMSLQVKPAPNWDLSLAPSLSRSRTAAQYLFAVTDPAAQETHGRRYVFAPLDQTVLSVSTRFNYTFTPDLSLQVFAQPFIASGAFGPAMEFAAPRTYDFLVYGEEVGEISEGRIFPAGRGEGAVSFPVPDPDFNIRSLRGNAVLRWEWRPGSTVFLAWQQTRSDFAPVGTFDLPVDARALFAASPDNIVVLKMSYWLNP
jgi:hypothetical protein